MLPWNRRPIEANLVNPAFCTLVLRQAIDGYYQTARTGMEFSLAFVVLPVVLHKAIRDLVPATIATKLHVWIQRHHEVRIGFAHHMQNMVPITKEALIFGMQHDAYQLDERGTLVAGLQELKPFDVPPGSEAEACFKKAFFVGRWFADAGTPSSVIAAWDITIK
ncbi:three component ABC system middle component [Hymenobacter defluvii]|uniref:Uncharacterized protein n=1 Tax=Hymenobacter defluvii TaxID=2054411 RepID=A0ABS3TI43_9BACT|nr:three component ABC system middle component [Hymenobacter defluvii]MBO3272370.1 hypothetical protein [Hymenobacter defluvii]